MKSKWTRSSMPSFFSCRGRPDVVTCGYMWLHVVTSGYMRLHVVTCGYVWLHVVTREVDQVLDAQLLELQRGRGGG